MQGITPSVAWDLSWRSTADLFFFFPLSSARGRGNSGRSGGEGGIKGKKERERTGGQEGRRAGRQRGMLRDVRRAKRREVFEREEEWRDRRPV